MSHTDSALLAKISKSCFFRLQPQPLVDLLNSRGIVGRPAEVFWTYFHWGFQNGSFCCQLSSSYIAEALFTDVRTVQRANERLIEAGLITRARARRTSGTHLEAPAITRISIPDDEVRALLESAPTRTTGQSEGGQGQRITDSKPASGVEPGKSFTPVNNAHEEPELCTDSSTAPSPTPKSSENETNKRGCGSLQEIKRSLPPEVQRLHDMCLVKASPGVFRQALDELGGIGESDAELLMAPLVKALECKRRELSEARKPITQRKPDQSGSTVQKKSGSCNRPDEPRAIPNKVISFIEDRLKVKVRSIPKDDRGELLKEIVYSITIGTLRGLDLMHAINTTIKLVSSSKWSKPLGMPDGWSYSHVLTCDQPLQGAA